MVVTATYPNVPDIPLAICVNMYDEHGKEGHRAAVPRTSTRGGHDNSINTNEFDPTTGDGFCTTPQIATPSATTTTTKASSSAVTLGSNGTVTDSVTVTGADGFGAPTGTVAFYVCGPTTANALCTSTATPVGTANLPSSGDTGFVSTGTSSILHADHARHVLLRRGLHPGRGQRLHRLGRQQLGHHRHQRVLHGRRRDLVEHRRLDSGRDAGRDPAAAPAAAAPVAGATVVTTGEPFAGSKGIEAGVALLGMGLLTMGLLRRRNLRRGAEARNR